jgi:putative flavoprotein involved in K+ transport
MTDQQQIDTLVIGGGQAGLAVGFHLTEAGIPFLIVDANERTGDVWRHRWDSMRLFTPNRFNSLPGLDIGGPDWGFPTKDQLADYLESYASHFGLPIRHGTRVDRLTEDNGRFVAVAGDTTYLADQVVVAMSSYQVPRVPEFAFELDEAVFQTHISDYRNPAQLGDGPVLVVGLGNSGAEIANELILDRQVYLSGEPSGVQPFRPEKLSGRILMPIVGPLVINGLLSTSTPMGRRFKEKMYDKAAPLMRVKPKDLEVAGVRRVGRVVGVADGLPLLDDGTILDVASVVWCTGYTPGFDWVDLPIFDDDGRVVHRRGVVDQIPGLYFVAIKFQHSAVSDTLLAVGREAELIVESLVARRREALVVERTG